MKAVTGNRLTDGEVVYLAEGGAWVEELAAAALYDDGAAKIALAEAQTQQTLVVDPYLIDAEPGGVASGQKYRRETIRATGPTVRPDLGKQAENGA